MEKPSAITDNRPEALAQRKRMETAASSPQALQQKARMEMINHSADTLQKKAGISQISGHPTQPTMSMAIQRARSQVSTPPDNVRVFDPKTSANDIQVCSAPIQMQRVFTATGDLREETPEDGIGARDGWCIYRITPDELVYVHVDQIVEFMGAYEDAKLIDMIDGPGEDEGDADEIHPAEEQAAVHDDVGEGLVDAGMVADVSTILHFQDRTDPENIVNRSANPADVAHADLATTLTPDPLPGTIIEVRFMSPANPANHFEVICLAAAPAQPGQEAPPPIAIKFDFNRQGYRMIYGANPDANGDRMRIGPTEPPAPITVADATEAFAQTSADGGEYREGANECGTFARNFYRALMNQNPE